MKAFKTPVWLRWSHVIFSVVGFAFAWLYLRDAMTVGSATSNGIKGGIWLAVALFMIVPEVRSWWRRRRQDDSGSSGQTA
jgi:hypothetical protein